MSKSNVNVSSGIGLMGGLGILFIGLKLTGFITWSWWLVLMPLYAGWLIVWGAVFLFGMTAAAFVFVLGVLGVLISAAWDTFKSYRKNKKAEKDLFG